MKPKALRQQLRAIAQELLPTFIASELFKAVFDQLQKQIHERLDLIDQRQAEIYRKLLENRELAVNPPAAPAPEAPAETPSDAL